MARNHCSFYSSSVNYSSQSDWENKAGQLICEIFHFRRFGVLQLTSAKNTMFGGRRGEEGFLYKSSQSVAVLQGRSLQQPLLPFPITGSTNTRISVNAILLNEGWGFTKLIALRMDPS